jgi:hypothetical protein
MCYIEVLIHIYIGVLLQNPREDDCTRAGGVTAWEARLDRSGRRHQGNPKTLDVTLG